MSFEDDFFKSLPCKHEQKLDPARDVLELAGQSVQICTSLERNVPAGQTIESEKI